MKHLFLCCLLLLGMVSHVYALDIQKWRTDKGATVLFVQANDLPMIDIRMTFKAGSSRDGDYPGISRLTNALLVEGVDDYNAEQIAATMESVGALLGHDSLRDMAWSSLRLLSNTANKEEIIDLFARVTGAPLFPLDAIERDRTSMLTSLKSRQHQIDLVAQDALFQALYKDHVYQQGSHGTEAGLLAITQSDLKQFHQTYYVAENATIAIVGDLSLKEAKQMAFKLTTYLSRGEQAKALKKPLPTVADTQLIEFDATQTYISLGLPALTRKDDDYFSLYVGNHILGGSGFGSRLMSVIREEKGLSYSVYSYFSPMESHGPFQMAMQTANHQADEARALLRGLLTDFIKAGPTDEELLKAKKNITGGFPLKIDSNRKIVEYLALMGFYDLPLDYLASFNERVEAVTVESIQDAFARRVDLEKMIEIVVGPL